MFRMDDLSIVLAVANCGGFAAAARETGMPTSTVSRAVARLEAHLGLRIFQRTSRTICLTAEGERLVRGTSPLVEELREKVGSVRHQATELSGTLRVTAPLVSGATAIADALLAFAEAHPRLTVELSITNSLVDLVAQRVDLAFRGGPIECGDFIASKLWRVPYVIAASQTFIEEQLGGERGIDAQHLRTLPTVQSSSTASWCFVQPDGTRAEVQPASKFVVNDLRVAIKAAQRGMGIVRTPQTLGEAAGLVRLDVSSLGEPEPREMYAVYPSRQFVPNRVRQAVSWVKNHITEVEP